MAKKNLKIKTTTSRSRKRYAGVTYKSELEKYMAMFLHQRGLPLNYETKKFTMIQGKENHLESWKKPINGTSVFKDRSGKRLSGITYTPDFVDDEKHFDKDGSFIIECKGYPTPQFVLRYKLFNHYCLDNYKNLTLYMPRTVADCETTADLILERYV